MGMRGATISKIQTAREWYQDWSKKLAARTALKLLKEIGGEETHIAITRDRIARACFDAKHYKLDNDPGLIYRAKMQEERKKLTSLARSARLFAQSAGRNDKGLMWACGITEINSGVRITRKEKSSQMAHNLVVEKYFIHLEAALSGRLPELHGGPWLHRFTIGNLHFNKAISRGRPVTTETMLAFELAFYLRMQTAGRAQDGIQNAQTMPEDGEPCFQVVAAFCSAIFGTSWDAKQIGDKVRGLKNVGLVDWPKGVNSVSNSRN